MRTSAGIVELVQGQGILINSGVLHRLNVEGSEALCPYIMFSEDFIAPEGSDISLKYVKPYTVNTEQPFLILDPSVMWQRRILDTAKNVISLLYRYAGAAAHNPVGLSQLIGEESLCYELDVHNRMCEIWSVICSNLGNEEKAAIAGSEYVARKRTQLMVDFIRENYRSQISLADIAYSANISKSEAARCFQSCLHTSPVSYLLRHRIETAAHLLQNSTMSIEAVSFECGFASASYFCKMFQRYTGMTPGAFRKGKRTQKEL